MRHRNQSKRVYSSPLSRPTEVEFEQALLVTTARFLLQVDELENMNIQGERIVDDATGEDIMYFEF